MTDVENKATDQAARHANKFVDENDWDDILEKYAEVTNRALDELDRINERIERGARIEDSDWADFCYYEHYHGILAGYIARSELYSKGYTRNKNKRWILKKAPPTPPKKKFGFWK